MPKEEGVAGKWIVSVELDRCSRGRVMSVVDDPSAEFVVLGSGLGSVEAIHGDSQDETAVYILRARFGASQE